MASILTPITDLDELLTNWTDNSDGTYDSDEISIDAINKTIEFKAGGNLSIDGSGATGQCLYSLLKNRWKNVNSIAQYEFPMTSITNEQFEFIEGWKPLNEATRKRIRTAGWAEVEDTGLTSRIFAGLITLGTLGLTDQPYFTQDNSITSTTTDTTFSGPVNEAVQIFGTTSNGDTGAGNFDFRASFRLFVRERGKTYATSDISDIGVNNMVSIVYRFPLSNADDLDIVTTADTDIDSDSNGTADVGDYANVEVTYFDAQVRGLYTDNTVYTANDVVQNASGRWFKTNTGGTSDGADVGSDSGVTDWVAYEGEFEIQDGVYNAFTVFLDANNTVANPDNTRSGSTAGSPTGATKEVIYEWAEWALRQTGTIDTDSTRNGNVANRLVYFIGSTLHTEAGVFIKDINSVDTNNVVFHDFDDATSTYPLVVPIRINFNAFLSNDPDAIYRAYYKSVTSGDFDTVDAVKVSDSSLSSIEGNVPTGTSGSVINYNYAFDGNTEGGRSSGTDTDIVIVGIGLNTGQYVKAEGTITSSGATLTLVAPQERNFIDPV